MRDPTEVLQTVFGYTAFRPGQEDIVASILAGKDVLAILPTGAGKSLCFQVPGLCLDGTTIVISPLISLMQDQVHTLQRRRVAAQYLSSAQTDQEKQAILQQLEQNQLKFIYVAPERLLTDSFLQAVRGARMSLLVIDEAHCISTWGHQFRPEYREIAKFRDLLGSKIPTAAFTATATPAVAEDMCAALKLENPDLHKKSFARPNLSIFSYPCESQTARELALLRLVKKHSHEAGIIYASTRSSTEEVAEFIEKYLPSVPVAAYHAGLEPAVRMQIQERFIADELQLIVATTAFGMGVDKSNIRFVIHYQLSASLENYYQEIGRAGRDGKPSNCYLLSVPHDGHIQLELIKKSGTIQQQKVSLQKLKQITSYAVLSSCYHLAILEYFGESGAPCSNRCSICLRESRDHELLYGLTDAVERRQLTRLLEWRTEQSEQKSLPERAVATDKQLCWAALTGISTAPSFGVGWEKKWSPPPVHLENML